MVSPATSVPAGPPSGADRRAHPPSLAIAIAALPMLPPLETVNDVALFLESRFGIAPTPKM